MYSNPFRGIGGHTVVRGGTCCLCGLVQSVLPEISSEYYSCSVLHVAFIPFCRVQRIESLFLPPLYSRETCGIICAPHVDPKICSSCNRTVSSRSNLHICTQPRFFVGLMHGAIPAAYTELTIGPICSIESFLSLQYPPPRHRRFLNVQ